MHVNTRAEGPEELPAHAVVRRRGWEYPTTPARARPPSLHPPVLDVTVFLGEIRFRAFQSRKGARDLPLSVRTQW